MCRYYSKIERLENELAYMKGKESTEGIIGRQALEIAELRSVIGDLKVDLKLCHRPVGEVILPTSKLGHTYINESRVLGSHPPVVEVERKHECGPDDAGCGRR